MSRGKQTSGIALVFVLLAVALVCLALLPRFTREGADVLPVTILSMAAVIVGASIAACLNLIQSAPSKAGGRSPYQRVAVLLVLGLIAVGVLALIVLGINFDVGEVEKTALGGLIALVGVGITAVLTMLRTEATRREMREQTEAVRAQAEAATEHAEAARAHVERTTGTDGD